jgi:hypothetical protein
MSISPIFCSIRVDEIDRDPLTSSLQTFISPERVRGFSHWTVPRIDEEKRVS